MKKEKTRSLLDANLSDLDYGTNNLVSTLDRKNSYIEFFGGWVAFGKWSLLIAIMALILSTICAVWAITVQKGITKEVQIVMEDSIGRLTPVSSISHSLQNEQKNEKVIASQLADYIIGIRSISSDIEVTKKAYLKSKLMTSESFRGKLRQYLIDHISSIPQGATVQAIIQTVSPVPGGKSWIINWKEIQNGIDNPGTTTYWTAVLNIDFGKPTDPDTIWNDPLGIIVTNLTIQPVNYSK